MQEEETGNIMGCQMAKQGQLKESCQCLGTCPKFLSVRKGEEVGYYEKGEWYQGEEFFYISEEAPGWRGVFSSLFQLYILRYFSKFMLIKNCHFFKQI